MISNSCGATTGVRMVAKRRTPRTVSGARCLTNRAVDWGSRGLSVTASVGSIFGGKVSWSRTEVLLRDRILKRDAQRETMAR